MGVTHIILPVNKNKGNWAYYRANFVEGKVREWLQNRFDTQAAPDLIASASPHIYKCLESESVAKKNRLFKAAAKKSPRADYLVLRSHDLLSDKGEIAFSLGNGHPDLQVRMLMLDFESLTDETFEKIKTDADLRWENDLDTEKRLAKERLAFADTLSRNRPFKYKLFPANKVPEMKLRLYHDCGFFSFYRNNGGKKTVHQRTLFFVADDQSRPSRLLGTLQQVYDDLWASLGQAR
jgi:hypothetical protein